MKHENLDVGNSNEDKVNEVSSGAVTSSQNIQRKRKRMTVMVPTITRKLNPRNKERVNYKVGSPRKR